MLDPNTNPSGFSNSSVLAKVHNIPSDRFLLIHGTGDDNVHFLNSMEIVKRLVSSGVQFRFMAYPNQAHALAGGGAETHVWKTLEGFLQACQE
jgi:dipeptidyl-peptidase-4